MIALGQKVEPQNVILHDHSEATILTKGKKYLLFFYPKDNTPGCTAEACSISNSYDALKKKGYEIYGVSVDSPKSHMKFIEKFSFPFPLISDESKQLVEYFGLWGKKKFMGREYMGTHRATFLIDENGIVTHVIDDVKTKEAAEQILEILG